MPAMYGQPYTPYRHRRSTRKYAYVVFLVIVVLLWKTGRAGRREPHPAETKPAVIATRANTEKPSPLPQRPIPRPYAHDAQNVQHPVALSPSPATPESSPRSSPVIAKGPTVAHDHDEEESESHDGGETIDTIKESTGDTVDHASQLEQAGDDDSAAGSDDEGGLPGTAKGTEDIQRQHVVDELVTEIMSDKKDAKEEEEGEEEVSDVEETAEAAEKAKKPLTSDPLSAAEIRKEDYEFPSWEECESVKDTADALPDILHVPFEDAVRDVHLEGWEDEWVAKARFTGSKLKEPKIDFVYNWVNGSQTEFVNTMRPYELNSTLNDPEGTWLESHSSNRYREWDELRYSVRSVEKYAHKFMNRVQFLVNAFKTEDGSAEAYGKQRPHWLKEDHAKAQVLSQEEFFGREERKCLPTFDSLTIENQIFNTPSNVDRMFALSDDMILGKPHAAADIYSPLFGPTMGFKDNAYNTLAPPSEKDAGRFGEKPFLIYTSWLLNRRFGARKRKGQVHFGHSLGRSVTREAITSFPRPSLRSAFQRFRGETGFQLYSWYVIFHYTIERHREVLLWSYIMHRSDANGDGYLDWQERRKMLRELSEGMAHDTPEMYRKRIFYRVADMLEEAGLEPPKVNTNILWTSLDGPITIKDLDCDAFDTEDCLAPGFSVPNGDSTHRSPVFSTAAIFDRVSRQSPRCGDCLLKLILNRRRAGLGPLLPHPIRQPAARTTVVKALMRYQYTIVEPDALFYMVTDAEQAEHILLRPYLQHKKKAGQICLNDDVVTTDEGELERLRKVMKALFDGLLPQSSSFER